MLFKLYICSHHHQHDAQRNTTNLHQWVGFAESVLFWVRGVKTFCKYRFIILPYTRNAHCFFPSEFEYNITHTKNAQSTHTHKNTI